jgi:hypothetical protein
MVHSGQTEGLKPFLQSLLELEPEDYLNTSEWFRQSLSVEGLNMDNTWAHNRPI